MIKNFIVGFFIGFVVIAWVSATITNSRNNLQMYIESQEM